MGVGRGPGSALMSPPRPAPTARQEHEAREAARAPATLNCMSHPI